MDSDRFTAGLLFFAAALLLVFAICFPVHAQVEVDSDEVRRRGDSIEYIDGWQGRQGERTGCRLQFEIVRTHPDIEKFFISIVFRKGDRLMPELLQAFRSDRELMSFAKLDDRENSWAHLNFYDLDDASQNWRFEGIRVRATPTIIVQPCKSGAWGDPSTVILQHAFSDPQTAADRIKYALQLYATKLDRSPDARRPVKTPWRPSRNERWEPIRAQYSAEETGTPLMNTPRVAPWRKETSDQPVEIPPLYQDDQGQCPGPGPCPYEPDQQPAPRGPWGPNRTPPTPFKFPDGGEIPPRNTSPLAGGDWKSYIVYGFALFGALVVGWHFAKGWMRSQGVPSFQNAPQRSNTVAYARPKRRPVEILDDELEEEEPAPAPRPRPRAPAAAAPVARPKVAPKPAPPPAAEEVDEETA